MLAKSSPCLRDSIPDGDGAKAQSPAKPLSIITNKMSIEREARTFNYKGINARIHKSPRP